jgi:hypothetical protein
MAIRRGYEWHQGLKKCTQCDNNCISDNVLCTKCKIKIRRSFAFKERLSYLYNVESADPLFDAEREAKIRYYQERASQQLPLFD